MRDEILMVPGFIPPEQVAELAAADFQPIRGRHDTDAIHVHGASVMAPIVWRVSDALAAWYGITEPLFCDYAATTRSTPGMGHVLHADNCQLDGTPNHTAWRTVTAMLYLSSWPTDFTGGELLFPRLGVTVQPKAGLLVGFRCDALHSHLVPAVREGERRALAFWFTTSPDWRGRVAPKGDT